MKVAYLKNLQGYLWENGYKTGAYSTPLFSDVAPQLKRWKEYGVILAIYSSGSVFAQKLLFGHVQTTKPITGQKRGLPTSHEDSNDGDVEGRPSKKRAADVKAGSSGEVEREVDSASTGLHDGFPADENAEKGGIRTQDAESASDLAKNTEDLQYLIADWFDTTNAGPKTEASSYEKIAHSLKVSDLKQLCSSVTAQSIQVSPTHVLFLTDNVLEVRAAQKAGMLSHAVVRPGNAPLSEEDKDRLTVVSSFNDINMPKRQPHEETLLRAKSEQKSDNS